MCIAERVLHEILPWVLQKRSHHVDPRQGFPPNLPNFVTAEEQMPCILLLLFCTEWAKRIIEVYISSRQVQFSGQSVPH